jgi:polysaccharide export outer membrane protein
MKFSPFLVTILVSGLLTSCITAEQLTYLQYVGEVKDTTISVTPEDYKILPNDNLFIKVVTPDPQWSDMFNTIQSNSLVSSLSEQSADLISYAVDSEGYIELPYAGKILVSGKTIGKIKVELETILKGYVSDAAVTVKLINNYISILGEVKQPGKYPIYKNRMNIFQALALAGDLGEFSNRQKVQVIRQVPAGNVVKEFSLIDRSILSSELFYVMPNDVIYAKPMEGRFFQMNSFPYALVLGTITTFILLYNVIDQ